MSDINTATMNRDQLEAVAKDLDISFQGNTKDDTLRKKIDEALGNPAPIASNDNPAPAAPSQSKRFEITVHTHERDKQPVQVGVNGRMYVIERGKKVVVPEAVVRVLETAVRVTHDPESMEPREVHSYPFTSHGEV
ncbi:hypothetical protein ACUN9Y_13255 [Halomonas sp. V046]|uniref:hypothetical protein n=1 Tax=Halomonas sp. V046 TaxID=3459611 RepID=UPI004043C115